MSFQKLPKKSKQLLDEILQSDNPEDMLAKRFEGLSYREDEELRGIIGELCNEGYISVMWADDLPYFITIKNQARTYNERLADYESDNKKRQIIVDRSVRIGDGNSISNSTIASTIQQAQSEPKKSFGDKHPVLTGLFVSIVAGAILMFSFWEKLIAFAEGLF